MTKHQDAQPVQAALNALDAIVAWQLPRVPDEHSDEPGATTSYGVAYGSNGERSYMRSLAKAAAEQVRAALAAQQAPAIARAVEVEGVITLIPYDEDPATSPVKDGDEVYLAAQQAAEPVMYVSPEQFGAFTDADEAEFGKYIPARKTPAGKFTMALYAGHAPATPQAEPLKGLQPWTEAEPVRLAASRVHRIYVAGPMTSIEHFNFPAFNAQADALRAEGWTVLNPADHGVIEGAEWGDYLRHDIAGLTTCEAIYLLPGWSKSKGARLERSIADALGMAMIFHPDAEATPPPVQPPADHLPDAKEMIQPPEFGEVMHPATPEDMAVYGRIAGEYMQAVQPQGCDYCLSAHYAGLSCPNCGRKAVQPMSDEQRHDLAETILTLSAHDSRRNVVLRAIDWTERHHGITQPQPSTSGYLETVKPKTGLDWALDVDSISGQPKQDGSAA